MWNPKQIVFFYVGRKKKSDWLRRALPKINWVFPFSASVAAPFTSSQFFGQSSNYCGKPPRCVKCDQPHATKDCAKPVSTPPKCVNCGREHPANFSGCPRYQQQLHYNFRAINQHQQQTRKPKPNSSPSQYQQSIFPPLRNSPPPSRPSQTWAQITAQTPNTLNNQPLSSTFDSIKSILTIVDFHKLRTLLRSLALQFQESNDPITKFVAIIDTVVGCLSSSP
jgi:hypothetical protein